MLDALYTFFFSILILTTAHELRIIYIHFPDEEVEAGAEMLSTLPKTIFSLLSRITQLVRNNVKTPSQVSGFQNLSSFHCSIRLRKSLQLLNLLDSRQSGRAVIIKSLGEVGKGFPWRDVCLLRSGRSLSKSARKWPFLRQWETQWRTNYSASLLLHHVRFLCRGLLLLE